MKPPLAYYGGKTSIAERIAGLLPPHEHYVEPFCGSLSVLLAKRPSRMETVNDLDHELIVFWRVLRSRLHGRGARIMSAAKHKPSDPAVRGLTPADCVVGFDGEGSEYEIQSASLPRATAMSIYASEMGVSWTDVSCKVAYLRVLTRQESFEHDAIDDAALAWVDAHDPPLKLNRDWKWATPDGTVVEPPDWLDIPPDDWEPGEGDPVWEWCEKSHPDAVRCWHLGVRPTTTSTDPAHTRARGARP